MRRRLPSLLACLAVVAGCGAVLAGLSVFVEAWQASRAWAGSGEAQQATVPKEAPIWLDEAGAVSGSESQPERPIALLPVQESVSAAPGVPDTRTVGAPNQRPASEVSPADAVARPSRAEVASSVPIPVRDVAEGAAPLATPVLERPAAAVSPSEIEISAVDFRFFDPPEPGAHARLALQVTNRADAASGPVTLAVPGRWFQSFEILGTIPAVLEDRSGEDGARHFVFDALMPDESRPLELHVLAIAEEIEAPEVRVLLHDASEVGRWHPRTVAPRPRPGPVRAVTIPKLGVRAPVIPVTWEPPSFVVGQLQNSAFVTLGNTVLIGHLAGPLGDVFARLDRLRPGDEVVATSRGQEYRFVVSEIAVRPYDDLGPTQPTETPRLSLMTCTGQWNVLRQDYSHRLWVVAEPPELAAQTIRANAERAASAAREAEAAAAARATHEAEVAAQPPAAEPVPGVAQVPSGGAAATPVPVPAPPAPAAMPSPPVPVDLTDETMVPGVAVDEISQHATVTGRVSVRGRLTPAAPPGQQAWLVVRADIEGSRWYALDRPLAPNAAGVWQADIDLGGPMGIRHEIRIGFVDAADDTLLRRHAIEHRGQPLDDLPSSFQTGARIFRQR